MARDIKSKIEVNGVQISVVSKMRDADYISLTDIAKYRNKTAPADVVKNWLRRKDTIEFLGLWEKLNNQNFNMVEFDQFKNSAGSNAFTLSPKQWIDSTSAIGLKSSSGRYGGGTLAHYDIAMEFASWVSPEFKLYIIKEFQRLKKSEAYNNSIEWNVRRELAKANYALQTDTIKDCLILPELTKGQITHIYASEADLLNVALFGMTASEFRKQNPERKGNQRDYASIEQNIVMANLQSQNALMIEQGLSQGERLQILRKLALRQLEVLARNKSVNNISLLSAKNDGEENEG
jgi:hypothetical protein